MHVGGLLLFEKPAGANRGFVGDLYRHLLTFDDVRPSFRRRPATPGPLIGATRWHHDEDIDLEYHVRLSALPRPGRVRELLTLVSQLHGTLLDRHRPLWEFHLIEGLADGRFAIYYKVHHALVDGVRGT
jgi:diacylglycerol O-acyltransferase / wax synthase